MAEKGTTEQAIELMRDITKVRNFCVCAHIDHGKTTFSDSLLAGAGMLSKELAGKVCALDFREDEQERGITIDAANVSMVHHLENIYYLINMIDTPGHVDFGGDVTRAMRAVDGAVVLIDAVEGVMPQTETVLKQALKEKVKPILFINKVDRLIKEVKLTPEAMQQRFIKLIEDINKLIRQLAPDEFKESWQVSVQDGKVAFGSGFHKWALSLPYMQKKKISFKDIIEAYEKDTYKELADKAPVHEVILNMVIEHHPNPKDAQKYRVPKIWHGDTESVEGKALLTCDPNGPVAFNCYKIEIDKHAGEVAAGRLFSGSVERGQEVYMNMAKRPIRVQQVLMYKGAQRTQIDKATCGNIIGIVGLKDVFSGETVSTFPIEPFESIKHLFDPVITKSIEAKKPSDLARLIEVLKQVNKEDPSITIEINEETGENLMHGMGELHLEVIENRIKREKGLDVVTSPPIVVYRESILKTSVKVEGKSPNKHNKYYITAEPLDERFYQAIKDGEIPEMRLKKKDQVIIDKLVSLGLMEAKEAKGVKEIFKGNVLYDDTRGIVHIGEVMEMTMDAFEQVMKEGPIAREPCVKLKINIQDIKLHEDAIHRGPAQIVPAVRDAIKQAMNNGGAILYEPKQILQIEAPSTYIGEVNKLIQNKRGQLLSMDQEGERIVAKAKMPVAEMFGLASDLRSATSGRGTQFLVDQIYEKLPGELQDRIVKTIRERKGLKVED